MKVAVVIPCYNEEKLIKKTINSLPSSIDHIVAVDDASSDSTLEKLKMISKSNKKVTVLSNESNGGVGFSLKKGFEYCIKETKAEAIGIVSGDMQCDSSYIEPMLDTLIDRNCDYVKGNRFMQRDALKLMPAYRKVGNAFISLLTKFSTGYYSISDTTMGFGFFRRSILNQVDYSFVRNRYDYENSMLIALSIAHARVKDIAVPAIYGEETSTIDLIPTVLRNLRTTWVGFWQRIYYKYIIYSLHPLVIFLFGGLLLSIAGWGFGLYLLLVKLFYGTSPSTGTVMIAVLPIILGLQLTLSSVAMDMSAEDKP